MKTMIPDSIKWIVFAVAFILAMAVMAWLGLLPDAIKNILEACDIAFSR